MARFVLAALLTFVASAAVAAPASAPAKRAMEAGAYEARTILALYDSRVTEDVRDTRAHRFAATPLNHLGLRLRFWDLARGLPAASELRGVRGVLAWLYEERPPNAASYLDWASGVIDTGQRFVVMGNLVGGLEEADAPRESDGFAARLGVRLGDRFVAHPYRAAFPLYDRGFVGFEWDVSKAPTGFRETTLVSGAGAAAHLAIDAGAPTNERAVLVATSPTGGYVQSGYEIRLGRSDKDVRWIVDPFAFFQAAFGADALPKPDVTTMVGRRVYYSHIDGDGWRSLSKVEAYRDEPTIAADVIYEAAIQPYPDLPVTVAPIAGDLDEDWLGDEAARAAARRIFAARQVEAAHHTYTHPFVWSFFEHYDYEIEKEVSSSGFGRKRRARARGEAAGPLKGYDVARAYAQHPFDLRQEIVAARDLMRAYLPIGKPIRLVQWSGDTRPFAAALRMVREHGLLNINGGDSRFDPEYPTVAAVAPIGVSFDGVRQIFASASNENTYTELWTRRFFGFRFLEETLRRTNAPRRLSAHNVYYHMYSGEKPAALDALLHNLEAARAAELAPIRTTDYVRAAEGFFDVELERLAAGRWRVVDRGGLQTVRFDGPGLAIDYARSSGLLGHRRVGEALYVALDPMFEAPEIAVSKGTAGGGRPYLEQARWPTEGLRIIGDQVAYRAAGYGAGAYVWQGFQPGVYRIEASRDGAAAWTGEAEVRQDGRLAFVVEADAIDGIDVSIMRRSFAEAGGAR